MTSIAVIGLGYVGIPLAIEFGKIYPTVGFDISKEKIASLKSHIAPGGEVESDQLLSAKFLTFSNDPVSISAATIIILAIPTLVDEMHQPDLKPLIMASKMVGQYMQLGVTVIYESTVYPGATEEICIPALESSSGMIWKQQFHVGYSPERVNPGDKKHTLVDIIKIVSGDCVETLKTVSTLYKKIIKAGVHEVSSIKVAEAAKVIENTQRDLNIAFMNEVSVISHLVGIDTQEVIEAAATKWNFVPLQPGLVGGHCIGVVPYYLTYKAQMLGYQPDVILAGRRVNNRMGKFIADQIIKQLIAADIRIHHAKVCIFGIAFKENVQDLSNSKIVDVINELKSFGIKVIVHDPVVNPKHARAAYQIELASWDELPKVDALVVATRHSVFLEMPLKKITSILNPGGCFVDIQNAFPKEVVEDLGYVVWRL